ncbi:peptide-methionine (S)-S-oxide reductase [Macrococcus caseolyticus]|uniref:peptide-methionine (S)-S-oxide reductase n=1 Tax=Macrococcoides caseolyticum TaxID=69966 RepID=UPI0024BCCD4B|nr:peptide-methionine (S)-S-oxide reductase [Macrococcus caseolyticus]MDJ1156408.1 peptide-methionine (S)-S-oxide reductase [Macrococcus caseolyticus]MEB8170279.1 peptide-methionine (S)-S-oxide reductase [Macrococcus caseolyticus]
MYTIYLAGGCLWGVQAFLKTVPGVAGTEAGRANGETATLDRPYDGYAECVKTICEDTLALHELLDDFFQIMDPYSVNKQGIDEGPKYRTGIYSEDEALLQAVRRYINSREDKEKIVVEVLRLNNYVRSADEHQDYLDRHPGDYCHVPLEMMRKYR